MIQSKYILDILDLALDECESENLLRQQISFLSENYTKHTGAGIYVYFISDKGIENYKIPTDKAQNFDIDGNSVEHVNGVEIKNESLKILADATIHLKNGFIDYIEIWNKLGDYINGEPSNYELTQTCVNILEKRTIKR